jgi:HEAT repeat protein
MWPSKRLRGEFPWLPIVFAVLAAMATFAGGACAQPLPQPPPVDPVELLRRVVESYPMTDEQLALRGQQLEKRIAGLQNLGELRRALSLSEWKFVDVLNVKLVDQDLLYRQLVGNRFKDTVKYFLNPKNSSPTIRMALADMIGEMGPAVRALTATDSSGMARSLAPDLVELLKDKSPAVRVAACRALGKINASPAEYVKALADTLTGDIAAVRLAAAEGMLTWIKTVDDLSRPGLGAGVSTQTEDVQDVIRKILPAVAPGLRDVDPEVRERSLKVIAQATLAVPVPRPLGPDNLRDAKEIKKAIDDIPAKLDLWRPMFIELKSLGTGLARSLEDPDPRVRAQGLQAVQEIAFLRLRIKNWVNSVPTTQAVEKDARLWRPVRTGSAQVMLASAQVVLPQPKAQRPGGFDEPNLLETVAPSVKVVARGVNDPNPRVRLAAIEFLDFMEDAAAPAADVLLHALTDKNRFVRWAAARALAKMPSVPTATIVQRVTPLLGDPDLDVRMTAAATLEHFGPAAAAAVPTLAWALTNINDPDGLMSVLNTLRGVRGAAGQPAVPVIAQLLRNPVSRVRRVAAETLGSFGTYARGSEDALRQVLNDDEAEVRLAASDALLAIAPQPPRK